MRMPKIAAITALLFAPLLASAQSQFGTITGVVRDQAKNPMVGAIITATKLDDSTTQTTISAIDGSYRISNVPIGMYSVMAEKEGFSQVVVSSLQIASGNAAVADFLLVPVTTPPVTNVAPGGFWKRFAQAYWDDWHDKGVGGPDPKYRGYPAPESNPPFPFTVWPYGGSPVIGQPNTMLPPLMTALYNGPNGEKWQASKVQIYGWIDTGFNVSSSDKPGISRMRRLLITSSPTPFRWIRRLSTLSAFRTRCRPTISIGDSG